MRTVQHIAEVRKLLAPLARRYGRNRVSIGRVPGPSTSARLLVCVYNPWNGDLEGWTRHECHIAACAYGLIGIYDGNGEAVDGYEKSNPRGGVHA